MEAGEPFGVAPGAVSQCRRIEAGLLSWGVDMTAADNPFEVELGHLVELDSGAEFIGRAALTHLRSIPVRRRLVGLCIDDRKLEPNEDIWPIHCDGQDVGRMTSLAYSPRLGRNIALGMVTADQAAAGNQLKIETWNGWRGATVNTLPFVKP